MRACFETKFIETDIVVTVDPAYLIDEIDNR